MGERPRREDRVFCVRLGDIEDREPPMHDATLEGFSTEFSVDAITGSFSD
jgi:hypothetical protein